VELTVFKNYILKKLTKTYQYKSKLTYKEIALIHSTPDEPPLFYIAGKVISSTITYVKLPRQIKKYFFIIPKLPYTNRNFSIHDYDEKNINYFIKRGN